MFVRDLNGRRFWVEAPDGGGNGGGGDGGSGSSSDAAFQRLLDRNNNDGIALARQLFGENYSYRQDIRNLKEEADALRGKVPAEGAVILTGDDAAAWTAYKALGKPDDLKQGLEQRDQLQGQLDTLKRETTLRTVAEAAGYKPGVLMQLDRIAQGEGKSLQFEVRDVEQDGQKRPVAYVKDGEAEKPLADYAASNWADFLPALTANGAQGGAQQRNDGTRFPRQHAGSGGQAPQTTKDVANNYIEKTYRRERHGSNRNE